MLNYNQVVRLLDLKPTKLQGPKIILVGVVLAADDTKVLSESYGATILRLKPKDLLTANSNTAGHFIFTDDEFTKSWTLKELWRVAKEGARIVVLRSMRNGVGVSNDFGKMSLEALAEYGINDIPYVHSDVCCLIGIIRKDKAKYYRR